LSWLEKLIKDGWLDGNDIAWSDPKYLRHHEPAFFTERRSYPHGSGLRRSPSAVRSWRSRYS